MNDDRATSLSYATTFSGIGGWEIGLNACGWRLQWQCERDPFCRALLKERFGVPIYDDIGTVWRKNPAPIDVLVGSPPCQPFSVAGKKCGTGDERHLYPAFIRLVGAIKPRWVLMEQVPAILSIERGRAFGGYLAGLAALRYDIVWHCIPACAVGAPHRRDRIWIIANRYKHGCDLRALPIRPGRQEQAAVEFGGSCQDVAGGGNQLRTEAAGQSILSAEREEGALGIGPSGKDVPHATQQQCNRSRHSRNRRNGPANSGETLPDSSGSGCQELNPPGFSEKSGHDTGGAFAIGDNWSTEPDVGRVVNGISFRVDRLKGLGNAVIPQIPYLIGQAINQIETLKTQSAVLE